MEYLEGVSLSGYLSNKGGRIPWQEAWDLLLPIMDALSAVHEKNIVHRDTKPDNIIITKDEPGKRKGKGGWPDSDMRRWLQNRVLPGGVPAGRVPPEPLRAEAPRKGIGQNLRSGSPRKGIRHKP